MYPVIIASCIFFSSKFTGTELTHLPNCSKISLIFKLDLDNLIIDVFCDLKGYKL